jgi:hypothetical protein
MPSTDFVHGAKLARNLHIREEIRDHTGQWRRITCVSIATPRVYVSLWGRGGVLVLDVRERVRIRRRRAGYGPLGEG